MKTYILNSKIFTGSSFLEGQTVILENGKIVEITGGQVNPEPMMLRSVIPLP